jgi:hypothetical protein
MGDCDTCRDSCPTTKGREPNRPDAGDPEEAINAIEGARGGDPPGEYGANSG